MPKKKHLKDTCSQCDELVWQYDEDGIGYCAAHARWKQIEVHRMAHPFDAHHDRAVTASRLEKATKTVVDCIQRLGYAEAFWVAEHLQFEWGVQWWNEQVVIRLTDLQMVAFAAAMSAHRQALYPKVGKLNGKAKSSKGSRSSLRG